MDSNPVWWFVGGAVGGVVGALIGKAAYNFIWSYYDELSKLSVRIVDVQRELDQYRRENDWRRGDNFKYLYDKIEDLKNRVTALEPKKTK